MNVLPQLRRSLVRAAERGSVAPARERRLGWRSAGRAVPALAAIGVALVVGFIALVSLHHATSPDHNRPAEGASTDAALRQLLGVLRRPQTAADRAVLAHDRILRNPAFDVIPSTVRVARVTPWGQLTIVGVKSAEKPAGSIGIRRSGLMFATFNRNGGGGGGCCADAESISTHGALSTGGAGRSFAGGSTKTDLTLVVPDGVAKVTFLLPRQPAGRQYGSPTYRSPLRVTVPVLGNVAAVRVDRECCAESPAMIWLAADGHVVKRIGNFRALGRVQPQAQPGPATALSRAAEQNPSTPNPVRIAPSTGGPHTKFTIHFRSLLNGAGYRWQITGPHCPSFTHPAGGEGNPNLLRGQAAAIDIRSISTDTLCPGTYRVSVSVTDLGSSSRSMIDAKPFGTGTFTVR